MNSTHICSTRKLLIFILFILSDISNMSKDRKFQYIIRGIIILFSLHSMLSEKPPYVFFRKVLYSTE